MGSVQRRLDLHAKVLEYWMIFLHWKFWRNWNLPLVLLETSWWAGLNGILFGNICCLIRQAVIGKFSHNTGYINKNLKERRRSKNPIRRKIKYKEKEKHKRARNGDATKRYEEGNREKHWINLNAKLLRGKTGLGLNISCLRCVQTNHETRSRLASVA
jgi:hypothetical protein